MADELIIVFSDGTTWEPVTAGATIWSVSSDDLETMMEGEDRVDIMPSSRFITKLPALYAVNN